MDADEYRRGRKTTWVVYGEDMAILAGDGLMIYAFEVAAKAFALSPYPERVGRAIGILAEKTGIYGMIGGQTVDVELTDRPMNGQQLDFVYRLKTGALLEASMMIGAVLAGASEDDIRKVEQVACDVGVAFQIQDDILDLTSTTEILGKPVGSDEKNNKTTYVTLYGLEQAKEQVRLLSERAIQKMNTMEHRNEFLEQLFISLIHREK
jgi:geranylgeranyl diphosphate synthase type II